MTRATMARALALGLIAGGAGLAAAQGVDALGQMRPGEYQIHEVGAKDAPRTVCVTDPKRLLQLEHGSATCTFRTITAGAQAASVRYVCPGTGNGTTDLTVESKSILRLHTQGVQRGAPFDTIYEARFNGACRAGLAAR